MAISIVTNHANAPTVVSAAKEVSREIELTDPKKDVPQVEEPSSTRESISREEVENLVIEANNLVTGTETSNQLQFIIAEGDHAYPFVVQVIDKETKKVIKEIPPEHMQQIAKELQTVEQYKTPEDRIGRLLSEFV